MIDKDKETEFSGEGLDGEKKEVLNEEQSSVKKVENSQAADPESVTEKNEEEPNKENPQVTSETNDQQDLPDSELDVPSDLPADVEAPSINTPEESKEQALDQEQEVENQEMELNPGQAGEKEEIVEEVEETVAEEKKAEEVAPAEEIEEKKEEVIEAVAEEKPAPEQEKSEGKEVEETVAEEKKAEEVAPAEEKEEKVEEVIDAVAEENTATDQEKSEGKKVEETVAEEKKEEESAQAPKGEEGEEVEDEKEEDDFEEEKDYSHLNKDELVNELEHLLKLDNMKMLERKVKELKPFYDEIHAGEAAEALKKFVEDGGSELDFQYVGDALDSRYSSLYEKYKSRKHAYYANLEKEKEENLHKKHDILEKLRQTVDGEETTTSIGKLKEIQNEWRSVGPVPNQHARSLWATYNILIDRFYDNRSIYFELKELDRKKNLESKIELCEKAEDLVSNDSIRDAVKELNELHEEFKHIGPVPKEMQEVIWQRFKSASDAIYSRRKEYVVDLKKELTENLELKKELANDVNRFVEFDSEKISDWNDMTRELLELQKKWETIGGLPREHAREVNKDFWTKFKNFFNNKNRFFKKLEGQRDDNLKIKEELVKKAIELKNSDKWDETASRLKDLQAEWKNVGPVPEKVRNEIYRKFKAACDDFFNRRREHTKDQEKTYKVNLDKKEKVCDEIEKLTKEKKKDLNAFKKLQQEYEALGFVPRNAIKKIQRRYQDVCNEFYASSGISDEERNELKFSAEISKLKSGPNADRRIQRKENDVRRLISKIENDIAVWRNNLEFFADSKTADKLREEFEIKIQKADAQLEELKEELRVLTKL